MPSGTLWAKYNIGATKESEYGYLFGWGCTSPYRLSGATSLDNTDNYTKSYANKIQTDLKGVTDTATANWGKGWKMPTKVQFDELLANCTSEWTRIEGINGIKFTSKKNTNYVFFPASGFIDGTALGFRGSASSYWSMSLNSTTRAYRISFDSLGVRVDTRERYCGFSVRAVRA